MPLKLSVCPFAKSSSYINFHLLTNKKYLKKAHKSAISEVTSPTSALVFQYDRPLFHGISWSLMIYFNILPGMPTSLDLNAIDACEVLKSVFNTSEVHLKTTGPVFVWKL